MANVTPATEPTAEGADAITHVFLARHGETDWNRQNRWQGHTDIALNQTGREQARLLADKVRALGITRVHSSTLVRARETAEIVASVLGLPMLGTDVDLRERGFGVFEGLTREECEARFPDAWSRYTADNRQMPPGAENQTDVQDRMAEAVRRLVARRTAPAHGEDRLLVVSHGSAIRALCAHATGVHPPPMPNIAVIRLGMRGGGFLDAELVG